MNSSATNPLLRDWTGPHGGLPPFDDVRIDQLEAAIDIALKDMVDSVERVANNPNPPTFANTVEAMEGCGRMLERVITVYAVMNSTMSTPAVRDLETAVAPKMAAANDRMHQNVALFGRISALYEGDQSQLSAVQQRLLRRRYRNLARRGAKLNQQDKARLSGINQSLAKLYTQFSQHLLKEEESFVLLAEGDLGGLSESLIAAARSNAERVGQPNAWAVINTRSSVDPFLTFSTRRDLRERVWRAFVQRGDQGNETDNNAIITDILTLRRERAHLLGYKTHAHWRLEDTMAGDPDTAMQLMLAVWPHAVSRVHQEVADMQAIADAEGNSITVAPWDYRHYQEKVRKDRYDLDQDEVKAYLQLEKLREGMFWAAGQLYGLTFRQIDDVAVVHNDVRVWEVLKRDDSHLGLFYFDPCARTGKRSGAWMNAYRVQERFDGEVTPIVSNNCNFVKGAPGQPVLISWDDAHTLFHEFGHALHGLLSDVDYPLQAGTAVSRDYVEFPSQVHEHWLSTPEILNRFAVHYKTGEAIPAELVAKLRKASTFNQGFQTTEFLASGLVDMMLHLSDEERIDPRLFEKQTLDELGMPSELVMRHRAPQFAHIFSGDGYSAGYYSYLWADTLTADAAEAFIEAGSMYDTATAERLRACVLSVGDTIDAAEGFRAFRGRDVQVDALMRDRGFAE